MKLNDPCACGCGTRPQGTRSRYAPGHDARHVSDLLEQCSAGSMTVQAARTELASEPLSEKLTRALSRRGILA